MNDKIIIEIDEELQIIRQQFLARIDEPLAAEIIERTGACHARLKDPDNVRILLNGKNVGKMSAKSRKILAQEQNRPELKKLATWGMGPMERTVVKFINIATGMHKMRVFKEEKEAIEWLIA